MSARRRTGGKSSGDAGSVRMPPSSRRSSRMFKNVTATSAGNSRSLPTRPAERRAWRASALPSGNMHMSCVIRGTRSSAMKARGHRKDVYSSSPRMDILRPPVLLPLLILFHRRRHQAACGITVPGGSWVERAAESDDATEATKQQMQR